MSSNLLKLCPECQSGCFYYPDEKKFICEDCNYEEEVEIIIKDKKTMLEEKQKRIKEKLAIVNMTNEDYKTLVKDRTDFGFDSIYFRYSEAIEELSWFKEMEARKHGQMNFNREQWSKLKKDHFYTALEQFTGAHKEGIWS